MATRDGRRRRVLSEEERVLWTTVTKSIAPLKKTSSAEEAAEEPAPPAPQAPRVAAPKVPAAPAARATPPAKPVPPPLEPLERRMRKRVARGTLPIDGRIDLHGLTQAQAHDALLRFLRTANARDARLVLVITGKGRAGDNERGVLRRQVPQWLGLPEFRALVVGYEDAHISHGGEGALYVRVRRTRGS